MPKQKSRDQQPLTDAVEFARRGSWLLGTLCHQAGEPGAGRLQRARAKENRPPAWAAELKWEPAGPVNIGGRTTCLAVPPGNPERVYLGSAGGGVWLSEDQGKRWRPTWPDDFEQNIGALVIDPRQPNVIYCGTGEANGSGDSYPGTGLYLSTDAGANWRLIATPEHHGAPDRIGAIAVDPFDSRHVLLGGVVKPKGKPSILVTRDGGDTWSPAGFVPAGATCHAIVFHPTRPGMIFAAIQSPNDARSNGSGVWRSTDGGANWLRLAKGLPKPERFRRTSLAISPSQPDTLFALASTHLGDDEVLLGVFRSDDCGGRWRPISPAGFTDENQMSYNNCIAVHPRDPDFVICGGTDLYLTRDSGVNWQRVTRWTHKRGQPTYAHADHHALVIASTGKRGILIYDGNDGGLDVSRSGEKWSNRSSGLATTMFYDVDVAAQDANHYGGGTQDNGTVITTGRIDRFREILGADGGWMVYDPEDCRRIVASEQEMTLFRIHGKRKRQAFLDGFDKREITEVWMAFIAPDYNHPGVAYAGSIRLWKTTNGGFSWKPCSEPFDISPITAIEVATADSNRIYVGTENGGFFRSTDGGATWSGNLARRALPRSEITRIESHPDDSGLLFLTAGQDIDENAHSHVFKSEDGGRSWIDVDGGRLPKIKHTALAFRTDVPDYLYVANHAGVFCTPDLGKTWADVTGNLPNAMPVDLVYHEGSKTLTVATYGRSLWRLKLA